MSRLWCIAPVLVVGVFGSGFLMGDDKKDTIFVNVSLPAHYKNLSLSPKQKNEVYKIRGKYRAEIQELYEKISELREKEKLDCEKVLSATQKARLRELLVGKKQGADDEEEPPVKVEKKKGVVAKDQKKTADPKGKGGPVEIKK
ncbi:MAG TPA: hypothetical protein VMI06_19435 [Terriglobia bacterium]|nr:hypothetical protein [Terriglobia bacterium]